MSRKASMQPDGAETRRRSVFFPQGAQPRPSNAGLGPGVLAARRATRMNIKAGGKMDREGTNASLQPHVNLEPTYRMTPTANFYPPKVRDIIKEVLEDHLTGKVYDALTCSDLTQDICDEIKDRVKHLSFDRYKLITMVTVGEIKQQGLMVTSRFSWDDKLDNYATFTFKNKSIFCTATVYGVYHE